MARQTGTRTDELIIAARAKLPDDLELVEFASLVQDVNSLAAFVAVELNGRFFGRPVNQYGSRPPYRLKYEVVRAQYGSDFMLVLSVVGAVGVAAAGIGGAFLAFGKGLSELATAGDKNEDRLKKKEDRLARRKQRELLQQMAADPESTNSATVHAILGGWQQAIIERTTDEAVGVASPGLEIVMAFTELAEYGVAIEVEMPGDARFEPFDPRPLLLPPDVKFADRSKKPDPRRPFSK